MQQTKEDQAINCRVAARLGTWSGLDHYQPSHIAATREYAHAVTARRVAWEVNGQPQLVKIHCAGWEGAV